MTEPRRVLVVGGGIAGMAAAVELVGRPDTTVEVWEAGDRLGGKIATSPFAGLEHVDEAADAFLLRVPHARALAVDVGLADELTSPTGATAAVWHRGLHDIPGGIVLGVPAAVLPFATTSLLSWRGKLRAALEPLLPRTRPDDSLGRLVRARFGDEVHDRLVDALIGSIYATDTDRSSLAAVPQVASLAEHHRSLLLGARAARRAAPPAGAPVFAGPRAGMAALVDACARHVVARGGTVRTGRTATAVEPDGRGWLVDGEPVDAVVLAVPPSAGARLLATVAPDAAEAMRRIEYADVVMVRAWLPSGALPDRVVGGRSGYLVPKSEQRSVTAASFASQKWAHWRPSDGGELLRVSLGRDGLPVRHLDDDQVVDAVLRECGEHLGVELEPRELSITRWIDAFPQYRPHHHQLVAWVERSLPPTLDVAGAGYRGIGIPACVADGRRAAAAVHDAVTGARAASRTSTP